MRYLVQPKAAVDWETHEVPVLVIGGGVAGLSAAIEAARHTEVLVITKAWLSDTATEWAQGGVAAVLSPEDSCESHANDTINVGCGLCDEPVVHRVVERGAEVIRLLQEWGGQFDAAGSGRLALGMEGGHSAGRIVHAHGDQTGREIQRVLVARARSEPRIRILEHVFALDVVTSDGHATGVLAFGSGRYLRIRAGAVIVATGGCGHVFRETTNPEVATGDGHAMLYRAGAILRGMEFVQFHPTTLYIAGSSRILISEAARGEGAILRDAAGEDFMPALHPRGCLAPRDFVSRAVRRRMVETGKNVYLDLRHMPPGFVRERFPRIYRVCLRFGLDLTREPIPVAPAAHYMIGGALVDEAGRTSVDGLYAVGEVACSGLHGANRLASNSLLEGLVLGIEAGRAVVEELKPVPSNGADESTEPLPEEDPYFDSTDLLNSVQALMWRHVGLLRNGNDLAWADRQLETWTERARGLARPMPRDWELLNLLQVASLIASAARERHESRGVHEREDFPERDDRRWRAHVELRRRVNGRLRATRTPLGKTRKKSREESS